MNTSDVTRPIVLDYLDEYLIYKRVLFWKPKAKFMQRADLLMRIEDELMRNLEALDIDGLNYCIPWTDIDRQCDMYSDQEPKQFYHSDKYMTNKYLGSGT